MTVWHAAGPGRSYDHDSGGIAPLGVGMLVAARGRPGDTVTALGADPAVGGVGRADGRRCCEDPADVIWSGSAMPLPGPVAGEPVWWRVAPIRSDVPRVATDVVVRRSRRCSPPAVRGAHDHHPPFGCGDHARVAAAVPPVSRRSSRRRLLQAPTCDVRVGVQQVARRAGAAHRDADDHPRDLVRSSPTTMGRVRRRGDVLRRGNGHPAGSRRARTGMSRAPATASTSDHTAFGEVVFDPFARTVGQRLTAGTAAVSQDVATGPDWPSEFPGFCVIRMDCRPSSDRRRRRYAAGPARSAVGVVSPAPGLAGGGGGGASR
jgi:hypothetical protein